MQNFRLRRYFGAKFSPAALFWCKIFACGAILVQNFRLRRYFSAKFSPAGLFLCEICGFGAIFAKFSTAAQLLCKIFASDAVFVHICQLRRYKSWYQIMSRAKRGSVMEWNFWKPTPASKTQRRLWWLWLSQRSYPYADTTGWWIPPTRWRINKMFIIFYVL